MVRIGPLVRISEPIPCSDIGVQHNVADKGDEELPGGKKRQYKEIKDNIVQTNVGEQQNIADKGEEELPGGIQRCEGQ